MFTVGRGGKIVGTTMIKKKKVEITLELNILECHVTSISSNIKKGWSQDRVTGER